MNGPGTERGGRPRKPAAARGFERPAGRAWLAGVVVAAAAAAAVAGCATRAEMVRRDRQLRRLVLENRRSVEETQRELERLRAELEEAPPGTRAGVAGEREHIAELERRIAALEERAGIGTRPWPPGAPAAGTPGGGGAAGVTPTEPAEPYTGPARSELEAELARARTAAAAQKGPGADDYRAALEMIARGEYDRAIIKLRDLQRRHKRSALAELAQFWVGQAYYRKRDYNQAILAFYDLQRTYPKGKKVPGALLWQGYAFVELGNSGDARLTLGKLIKDYPGSEEAEQAREKLATLEE